MLNSGSRHQRNRSLDSVLQKIPELEIGDSGSGASCEKNRSGDRKSFRNSGHPPLKPCLSLSLDPSANLFRFKDSRRSVPSIFQFFTILVIRMIDR